jgi:putative membrane protein insertion efficiency factor
MSRAKAADRGTPSSGAGPLNEGGAGLAFRLYKVLLSPVLHAISPTRCLYLPTCSEYAYTAVTRFGLVRGSWMALCRFGRCHPWGKGGLDPVPDLNQPDMSAGSHVVPSGSCGCDHNREDHLP